MSRKEISQLNPVAAAVRSAEPEGKAGAASRQGERGDAVDAPPLPAPRSAGRASGRKPEQGGAATDPPGSGAREQRRAGSRRGRGTGARAGRASGGHAAREAARWDGGSDATDDERASMMASGASRETRRKIAFLPSWARGSLHALARRAGDRARAMGPARRGRGDDDRTDRVNPLLSVAPLPPHAAPAAMGDGRHADDAAAAAERLVPLRGAARPRGGVGSQRRGKHRRQTMDEGGSERPVTPTAVPTTGSRSGTTRDWGDAMLQLTTPAAPDETDLSAGIGEGVALIELRYHFRLWILLGCTSLWISLLHAGEWGLVAALAVVATFTASVHLLAHPPFHTSHKAHWLDVMGFSGLSNPAIVYEKSVEEDEADRRVHRAYDCCCLRVSASALSSEKDSEWSTDTRRTQRLPSFVLRYAIWGGFLVVGVVALGVPLVAPAPGGDNSESYFNSARGAESRFEGTGDNVLRARCEPDTLPPLTGPNATVQLEILQHEATSQARDYVAYRLLPVQVLFSFSMFVLALAVVR